MSAARFACGECGAGAPKWIGRCPECGAWNSFVEAPRTRDRKLSGPRAAAARTLEDVGAPDIERLTSGIADFDRVLGGGLVGGSTVLLAGEPGVGKSTLLLQAAGALARAGKRALYVAAEESLPQIRLRADRLGVAGGNLLVTDESDPLKAAEVADSSGPDAVLVDSVQAMASPEIPGVAGSVAQVRATALAFVRVARRSGAPVILVGHITKDGSLAGPKSLEHLVDVVLSFEGDRSRGRRVLRALKNRFGPVDEVALFEMTGAGLAEITDPSTALLSERRTGLPGSAVGVVMEGTRPLLVEVQALVGPSSPGSARRSALGADPARLSMILAVLESRANVALSVREIFVSCAGGLELREPAGDLALAAAILSSNANVPLPADAFYFGEIGLLGEVRSVPDATSRLREAALHGFRRVYLPRGDAAAAADFPDLAAVPVSEVGDLARNLR
jgi:DNA repair protein RadA/Sms